MLGIVEDGSESSSELYFLSIGLSMAIVGFTRALIWGIACL